MTDVRPEGILAEFPHCDLVFVRKHAPDCERLAREYNRKRALVDPDDSNTIEAARQARARLLAKVGDRT